MDKKSKTKIISYIVASIAVLAATYGYQEELSLFNKIILVFMCLNFITGLISYLLNKKLRNSFTELITKVLLNIAFSVIFINICIDFWDQMGLVYRAALIFFSAMLPIALFVDLYDEAEKKAEREDRQDAHKINNS
jgi:phage-related holin